MREIPATVWQLDANLWKMMTVSEIRQDFQERGSKLNIMIYLLERSPIMQWLLGLKK